MKKSRVANIVFFMIIMNNCSAQAIDTLVDVGGYRLYFHIIKGEGMPILFEGGAGADVSTWDTLLQPVAGATQATLITYDRAGYGSSELDSSNHDIDKHGVEEGVRGLEVALEKLGYSGRLMLVAHSYGGFCATLFAGRVRKIYFRWRKCHEAFTSAVPNRESIIAYGCGHFIYKDNPQLALREIVRAYRRAN